MSDMFDAIEHAGAESGPVVALIGGVHGDEEEGVLAVQRVSAALQRAPLKRGLVRGVAVAHRAAYDARLRVSPDDGLNLARCFPGDSHGRPTERLAAALTEQVIRGSDLLIDLHSAGDAYEMPTFVGYVATPDDVGARSARAAVAFGAPLAWEHTPPVAAGRTLSAALDLRVPGIYVEGSGGGSLERDELDLYVDGVFNVLEDLGMLASPRGSRRRTTRIVRGDGDLDAGITAPGAGRFVASRRAGDTLAARDLIGEIVDEAGDSIALVRAPADATLMFLRRRARVDAGEVLCGLGAPAADWEPR